MLVLGVHRKLSFINSLKNDILEKGESMYSTMSDYIGKSIRCLWKPLWSVTPKKNTVCFLHGEKRKMR